jgi:protein-L-isoaspartate(D-aspartate) O-methyltransferase
MATTCTEHAGWIVAFAVLTAAASCGVPGEPAAPANVAPQVEDAEPKSPGPADRPPKDAAAEDAAPDADPGFQQERERMVALDIAARGVSDPAVLDAMRAVPRHLFVPEPRRAYAYADRPLPIGLNQTISQPYIVALMTELAGVKPGDRVLEIGTGSGYQAAVLSQLAKEVYSIEILEELSLRAQKVLEETGRSNLRFLVGDGYRGWPEAAPFDAIVVTAAPPRVPQPLVEQLAVGGRMVIPVGTAYQELLVLEKTPDGVVERRSIPVRFVPMTGEAQQ